MKVGDWTKLITLILVDLGVIFLLLFDVISGEAGLPILAASLGYVFGNTHAVISEKKLNK